jgi:hypothetical protein
LGAALAVFYQRHRQQLGEQRADSVLKSLGTCLLVNLAYAACNKRVDTWGHLGGALGGAFAAWLLGPRLVVVEEVVGGVAAGGGGGGALRGTTMGRRRRVRLEDRPPVGWLAGTGGMGRIKGGGGGGGKKKGAGGEEDEKKGGGGGGGQW